MSIDTDDIETDGENLFFAHLTKDAPKEPSEKDSEAPPRRKAQKEAEETEPEDEAAETEDDESPSEESEDEEGEGEETEKKYADGDDTYVKVKIGDEEHEVPVSQLKRLYGQETALTQRSQEVATQRKSVETAQ